MHDQAASSLESEPLVFEITQAPGEQARANQKDHRERNLRHDERSAGERGVVPSRVSRPAQDLGRLHARRSPGGRGAKYDAGDEREEEGKPQHQPRRAGVNGKVLRTSESDRQNGMRARKGYVKSSQSAQNRQQNTFGQHLTNQPLTRSAQRRAHGGVEPARRAARQEQVGDVGASGQQHQAGDGHQEA